MKKTIGFAFVACASLFFSSPSYAGDIYALAEYGSASMTPATGFPNPSVLKIGIGLADKDFTHDKLSAASEFTFLSFGNSVSSSSTGNMTLKQYSIQGYEKVGYEVVKHLSITGNFGFCMNNAEITGTGSFAGVNGMATGFDIVYGIGARYNATDSLAITADWQSLGLFKAQASATGESEYLTSVGLRYSF